MIFRGDSHRRSAGFTIIELLVALVIVAILAALSINLTKSARSVAHQASCASNLRQLGTAVRLYLNDHDNHFPPYVEKTREGTIWYFGRETGGGGSEGERELDREAGPLYPYIQQTGSIEVCPAFNYGNALYKAKFKGASWGYGYNWKLGGGWSGRNPMHVGQLSNQARVIVFGDCAQANTFQAPASASNPMLEEFYIINETFKTVHFRHVHSANFLFADGHVEAKKMHEGTKDERMESEALGRITPEGSMEFLE
jgi:prepilin-type N-terminal cleavage/methylation domain-containing protein/prepilin-type processing-associated H-X9-DG protein